jgi:hypothetical protein
MCHPVRIKHIVRETMNESTTGNEPTSTNLGNTSATFHEEVAEAERRIRLEKAFAPIWDAEVIEPSDQRLRKIWERAAEIATDRGYCDEFDYVMAELGTGFTRERHYYVEVEVTRTAMISIPVTCLNNQDPVNMVSDDDVEEYVGDGEYQTVNWEITEINRQD